MPTTELRTMSNNKVKKYTFSGHESFPCKSLWLKKGYDYVVEGNDFNSPEAVIGLGVGKNMVSSIRYWLKVFGMTKDDQPSELAQHLFEDDGWDSIGFDEGGFEGEHDSCRFAA